MSSNVFRCCVADICEEYLSSMRFRSLQIKLILNFLAIAVWWWTNNGFLAVYFIIFFLKFKRAVAILGYGEIE